MREGEGPRRVARWLGGGMALPGVYTAVQRAVGHTAVWTRLVGEVVRPTPGLRVLDVGCGPADALRHLPSDVEYVGLDPHAPYLEAARRRHPRATFRAVSVEALAAERPAPFDVVLFTGVLHHLDDATARRALEAARGLLAPGGRIVTLDPLREPGQGLAERALFAVDRGRHVRDQRGYVALFGDAPLRTAVWPRALRLPYTFLVVEARGRRGADLGDHATF